MVLTLVDKAMEQDYIVPDMPVVFVGRGTGNTQQKDKVTIIQNAVNLCISRQHCVIHNVNGNYSIEDSKSRFGTYVNEEQIKGDKRAILENGTKLKLGEYELEVKVEGA